MKLLSISFVPVLSCLLLVHSVSGKEKIIEVIASSDASQKGDPDKETKSPTNQVPPAQIKPGIAINEPSINREETDEKKTAKETGYFDFLWATQMPNWISMLGWGAAALIAWWSLGAVRRQADLTKESIKIADQGLRSVERAWLSVALASDYTPKAEPHTIAYVITNGGKTPAKLKELVINPINISDVLTTYDIPRISTDELSTLANIFAGESQQQIISTRKMDREPISEVIQGKKLLIISGWVIYDDVFGERHVTRFYQVYSPGIKSFIFPRDADPKYNEAT